jgi:hypothetical protein
MTRRSTASKAVSPSPSITPPNGDVTKAGAPIIRPHESAQVHKINFGLDLVPKAPIVLNAVVKKKAA